MWGVEWVVGGGEGGGCGLGVKVAGVGRLVMVLGRLRCIGVDDGGRDKIENGVGNNPTWVTYNYCFCGRFDIP